MRETWIWKIPAEQIVEAAKERLHKEEIREAESRAAYKAAMEEAKNYSHLGRLDPGGPIPFAIVAELERWIKLLSSFKGAEYALDKSDMDFFGLPTETKCVHSCSCGKSHG